MGIRARFGGRWAKSLAVVMDHERLKCWVPLHRALELLSLRSHRKLQQLADQGLVEVRMFKERRYYWNDRIEKLADEKDRQRSSLGGPNSSRRHNDRSRRGGDHRPLRHRNPSPAKSRLTEGPDLSGEEMSILSEPVHFLSDDKLETAPERDSAAGSTQANGHSTNPAAESKLDADVVQRIESELGQFRATIESLQRSVEIGARRERDPEVIEAELIPPPAPATEPPEAESAEDTVDQMFRQFHHPGPEPEIPVRRAVRSHTTMRPGLKTLLLILLVLVASMLASSLILGL